MTTGLLLYFFLSLTVRPPGYQTTPPAAPGPILSQREEGSSQLEVEPDIQDVVSVLVQALAACRQNISVSW